MQRILSWCTLVLIGTVGFAAPNEPRKAQSPRWLCAGGREQFALALRGGMLSDDQDALHNTAMLDSSSSLMLATGLARESGPSTPEWDVETYRHYEVQQMRAEHSDFDEPGYDWAGAKHVDNGPDAEAREQQVPPVLAKLKKGRGERYDGGSNEFERRPLFRRSKYQNAPDEETAFCMMFDDYMQDRRGAMSKMKHMNSRSRRIQETGSLVKKPFGSRRQQQGATAAAMHAADAELMAICYHLLKDTVSNPFNADKSAVYGRKWYNTTEGREYLEQKRKLDEFASKNKLNELFAKEWGCLPEELRQAENMTRELQRHYFSHLKASSYLSESTPDSPESDSYGKRQYRYDRIDGTDEFSLSGNCSFTPRHKTYIPKLLRPFYRSLKESLREDLEQRGLAGADGQQGLAATRETADEEGGGEGEGNGVAGKKSATRAYEHYVKMAETIREVQSAPDDDARMDMLRRALEEEGDELANLEEGDELKNLWRALREEGDELANLDCDGDRDKDEEGEKIVIESVSS